MNKVASKCKFSMGHAEEISKHKYPSTCPTIYQETAKDH